MTAGNSSCALQTKCSIQDTFSVDRAGNMLKRQLFCLNWAWISLEEENYVIDENFKFLEVTIRHRGYLQKTSFISM